MSPSSPIRAVWLVALAVAAIALSWPILAGWNDASPARAGGFILLVWAIVVVGAMIALRRSGQHHA